MFPAGAGVIFFYENAQLFGRGPVELYNISVDVDLYCRSEVSLNARAFRVGAVDSYEVELCTEYDKFTSESDCEGTSKGQKGDDVAAAVKPGAKVRIKVKREGDEIIYKVTTK